MSSSRANPTCLKCVVVRLNTCCLLFFTSQWKIQSQVFQTRIFVPFLTSQEMTVDDAHIRSINTLAMKLERQNKEETKTIYERRKQLNEK